MLKQAILVRKDLKMPKGKMSAQAAHASVDSVLKSSSQKVDIWRAEGMKKIILQIPGEKEIFKYASLCKRKGLVHSIITDAGRTVVEPGTVTCLSIGPDEEDEVDKITKDLKLYN